LYKKGSSIRVLPCHSYCFCCYAMTRPLPARHTCMRLPARLPVMLPGLLQSRTRTQNTAHASSASDAARAAAQQIQNTEYSTRKQRQAFEHAKVGDTSATRKFDGRAKSIATNTCRLPCATAACVGSQCTQPTILFKDWRKCDHDEKRPRKESHTCVCIIKFPQRTSRASQRKLCTS
jgi:hypothetical protein